jgi:hypothetical protein
MPLVIVIDKPGGGTARLLAPVLRKGMDHELYSDPEAALRHVCDPSFAPAAQAILIGAIAPTVQARLLASVEALRPDLGPRIILVTQDPRDDRLSPLIRRLGIRHVLPSPFGVEDVDTALAECVRVLPEVSQPSLAAVR